MSEREALERVAARLEIMANRLESTAAKLNPLGPRTRPLVLREADDYRLAARIVRKEIDRAGAEAAERQKAKVERWMQDPEVRAMLTGPVPGQPTREGGDG